MNEVATKPVFTCGPNDDVHSALKMLRQHQIRRMPVIGANGRLAGILCLDEIVLHAHETEGKNQDVPGDLYEYLLSKLNTAGQNGQFRTPRHIIRMMVNMCDPRPGERICDPAAGTCGFLVNAWQHLLETHTDPRDITFDEEGYPHGLTGSKLSKDEWEFSQTKALSAASGRSFRGSRPRKITSCSFCCRGLARRVSRPLAQYASVRRDRVAPGGPERRVTSDTRLSEKVWGARSVAALFFGSGSADEHHSTERTN